MSSHPDSAAIGDTATTGDTITGHSNLSTNAAQTGERFTPTSQETATRDWPADREAQSGATATHRPVASDEDPFRSQSPTRPSSTAPHTRGARPTTTFDGDPLDDWQTAEQRPPYGTAARNAGAPGRSRSTLSVSSMTLGALAGGGLGLSVGYILGRNAQC